MIFLKGVKVSMLSSFCLAHVSFWVKVNQGKNKHVTEILGFAHWVHGVFSSLDDIWEWGGGSCGGLYLLR